LPAQGFRAGLRRAKSAPQPPCCFLGGILAKTSDVDFLARPSGTALEPTWGELELARSPSPRTGGRLVPHLCALLPRRTSPAAAAAKPVIPAAFADTGGVTTHGTQGHLPGWIASPQEGALVRLLRTLPGPDAGFARAWSTLDDPVALLGLARAHALEGPLRGALAGLPQEAPAPLPQPPGREAAEARLRHAWTRAALDEASAALDEAKLRHVVLKGPLLAEDLYSDPGQRVSLDLDLLVAPADLELALSALLELGYFSENGPHATYSRAHHVHLHLARADRPLVELHFRAFRGFGIELAAEPLLARSLPRPGAAGSLRVLEPHDRFVYLALHAAGHLLERLGWLYDLKLFLAKVPLDPTLVAARAEELGAGPAVALACSALAEIEPSSATLDVLRALLPTPRRLPLAARLRRAHQRGPRDTPRATLERIAFQTLLAPSPPAGARFLAHHLGRIARRRFQRALPALAPQDWAG